jgi:multiple sugar transport system ATP-binding protein
MMHTKETVRKTQGRPVMTMGDRVAVLRFGKLQQFASPNELDDRPANLFVAGFIGSPAMNIFNAALVPGGVQLGREVLPSRARR